MTNHTPYTPNSHLYEDLLLTDGLASLTRRLNYLSKVAELNRMHPLRVHDLPGLAEALDLLATLQEKIQAGEL